MSMSALAASLERMVLDLISPCNYYAIYTATVVSVNDDNTLEINPANPRFAGMSGIPLWDGLSGGACTLSQGQMVLFSFLDGNPAAPYVLGSIGVPSTTSISAVNQVYLQPDLTPTNTPQAARKGDTVSVTITPAVITALGLMAGAVAVTASSSANAVGTITSGSPIVGIGPKL